MQVHRTVTWASARWVIAVALAVQTCAASSRPAVQGPVLPPIDDAATDASFAEFRARFIAALDARDARFVSDVVDPAIRVSFGPDSGAAAFHTMWRLSNRDDPFWDTMRRTLALGGQFESPGLFCAPYVYTAFPEELPAFDSLVVIRRDVPLRSAADANSRTLRPLSYDIVRRNRAAATAAGWSAVTLADGTSGYVPADDVRSPTDYRACFARSNTSWRLTIFIAGD